MWRLRNTNSLQSRLPFPFQVFKDNCCKREILALQIYCRNEGRGCAEQLTLGHLLVSPGVAGGLPQGEERPSKRAPAGEQPSHLGVQCCQQRSHLAAELPWPGWDRKKSAWSFKLEGALKTFFFFTIKFHTTSCGVFFFDSYHFVLERHLN